MADRQLVEFTIGPVHDDVTRRAALVCNALGVPLGVSFPEVVPPVGDAVGAAEERRPAFRWEAARDEKAVARFHDSPPA